jgi:hypothetical protein
MLARQSGKGSSSRAMERTGGSRVRLMLLGTGPPSLAAKAVPHLLPGGGKEI